MKINICKLCMCMFIIGLFPAAAWSNPVMEYFKTGSREKQIFAMHYFSYSKNKRCFWYLVKNLNRSFDKEDKNTWGPKFRSVAAESLGRLSDERAVPFLIKRYKKEKNLKVKKSIIFFSLIL